ncbi:hypothetical protein RJ639_042297 [Escallonia herrerae]|uniref:Uncharacterized protein n=1 Tax=Escallonia herrerae TaxID=1293975 RepID=A0AA88WIL0_9ASTE|nr:hypothetical protein RJ639_042297 [Escallonia herrerae]
MGIRHVLNPPLPAGYYGNAFQSANAVLTGRDLNEWPVSRVAKMIKESKKVASDTNYIWNSINLLETLRHHKMKIETGSECLPRLLCSGRVFGRDSARTEFSSAEITLLRQSVRTKFCSDRTLLGYCHSARPECSDVSALTEFCSAFVTLLGQSVRTGFCSDIILLGLCHSARAEYCDGILFGQNSARPLSLCSDRVFRQDSARPLSLC